MCDWTPEVYSTVNLRTGSTQEFQVNLAAAKLCSLSRKRSSPAGGAFCPQPASLTPGCPRTYQALNFKELDAHPRRGPWPDPCRNSELAGDADPCLESRGSQANFQAGETALCSEDPPPLQAEGEASL